MELIDTHTHPHMAGYELPLPKFFAAAELAGVTKMICVGTDATDSASAIALAERHSECAASVGLHPHEAKKGVLELERLEALLPHPKVVAIGECGLDYYYDHSPRASQARTLQKQLEIAKKHDLPLIFHVRDAFSDFFEIIDDYSGVRGVVHSFSADRPTLEQCLERGLHIGLNGIMTFTKDQEQLTAARAIPLDKLLLETDSPFLTPHPYRGIVNGSAHVRTVAEFLCNLRGETLEELAAATTANARGLFKI